MSVVLKGTTNFSIVFLYLLHLLFIFKLWLPRVIGYCAMHTFRKRKILLNLKLE